MSVWFYLLAGRELKIFNSGFNWIFYFVSIVAWIGCSYEILVDGAHKVNAF